MTTTKTVTLGEFLEGRGIASIWTVSQAVPGGSTLTHDTDTESDEDWCDLDDIGTVTSLFSFSEEVEDMEGFTHTVGLEQSQAWDALNELSGDVEGDSWKWDGEGDVRSFNSDLWQLQIKRRVS